MNVLKFFLTLCFLTLLTSLSTAQDYKLAVGARLGYPFSASVKYKNNSNALEAYVGFRGYGSYSWVSVTGAYQKHRELSEILEGLSWYAGGGASLYFWTFDFVGTYNTSTVGLQGYLGLDYKFSDYPINVSVDWIPTVFIGNGYTTGFGGGYGALAVRYTLGNN